MASSSFGQISALNAESYCERVLTAAKGREQRTHGEGNTLLADEELEMHVPHEPQVHGVHARPPPTLGVPGVHPVSARKR